MFPADHLEMPAVQKQSEDLKQNKQTKKIQQTSLFSYRNIASFECMKIKSSGSQTKFGKQRDEMGSSFAPIFYL